MRILLSHRTVLFGIALTGFIQNNELCAAETLDTLDLDVTFIGDREVLLQDAHKQLHWPEASSLQKAKPTFSYSMLPKRLNVQPEWKRNGPVRLRVDQPLPRLYQGFVQAGLGNFISPSLDFSYTDLRSRKGTWGVRGTHHSSQGGYADIDSIDDRFSSNSAEMWAKRFYGKEAVELSTHFKRERNSYFGGDTAFSTSSFPATFLAFSASTFLTLFYLLFCVAPSFFSFLHSSVRTSHDPSRPGVMRASRFNSPGQQAC